MQISKDHSLREITGNKDIASNIITNSFGGGEKIFVDFDSAGSKIFSNDAFLLCSDGLSDELNDEEIEETLGNKKNAVDELLKKAKNKGGKDNISIILVYLSGVENENNR
jgi:protein phosphatase